MPIRETPRSSAIMSAEHLLALARDFGPNAVLDPQIGTTIIKKFPEILDPDNSNVQHGKTLAQLHEEGRIMEAIKANAHLMQALSGIQQAIISKLDAAEQTREATEQVRKQLALGELVARARMLTEQSQTMRRNIDQAIASGYFTEQVLRTMYLDLIDPEAIQIGFRKSGDDDIIDTDLVTDVNERIALYEKNPDQPNSLARLSSLRASKATADQNHFWLEWAQFYGQYSDILKTIKELAKQIRALQPKA